MWRRLSRVATPWLPPAALIAVAAFGFTPKRADRPYIRPYVHDTVGTSTPIRPPPSDALSTRAKVKMFGGHRNEELADQIASYLGIKLSKAETRNFADGETSVKLNEPIEQGEVFIIQSTGPPVNESLMELLLLVSTVRRCAARRITVVVPYFGYKRDTTMSSLSLQGETHVSLSAADVALMLQTLGVDCIISVDLQPPGYGQIEGFFENTVRVENLRPYSLAIKYLLGPKSQLSDPVVVASNETCVELAEDFKSGMEKRLHRTVPMAALVHGENDLLEARKVSATPRAARDNVISLSIVGDVKGKDVLLVDDLIDTAEKLTESVKTLNSAGARKVILYATHCLLTSEAIKIIQACDGLVEVVVTNTIPLGNKLDNASCSKLTQISIAPLLAEAVRRVIEHSSLQDLRVYDKNNVRERYPGQGKE